MDLRAALIGEQVCAVDVCVQTHVYIHCVYTSMQAFVYWKINTTVKTSGATGIRRIFGDIRSQCVKDGKKASHSYKLIIGR